MNAVLIITGGTLIFFAVLLLDGASASCPRLLTRLRSRMGLGKSFTWLD